VGPDSLATLRTPAGPPPPFEELPARPLFAETERRAPGSNGPVSLTTWAQTPRTYDTADSEPTEGNDEFWPFTDPHDSANDVHTGTEGRGWLRMGIVVVVLVLVVVAMVVAFNRGRRDAASPGDASNPSPSGSATPASRPIAISGVSDFDPLGDKTENPDTVSHVDDGDPTTTWQTSTYYHNPALGGLKPGVGVLLDLGRVRDPRSVTLRLKGQPTALKVYAAPADATRAPTALDQLQRVGGSDRAPERTTIDLGKDTRTRYLLVWLTRLPSVPGGYRGEIAEISVRS
jgi:hypothetical protein